MNVETMVASGWLHYFFLKADGSLYAMGSNSYGQLGTGNNTDVDNLTQITNGVAAVYTGQYTSFILKRDGSLHGTGRNEYGQLGLGDNNDRSTFAPIPVQGVKGVSTCDGHTLILKNDGSVWAIGINHGTLGVGDNNDRDVFTATNLTSDVIAVATCVTHSLALKKDGTVWGTGEGPALGLTTFPNTFVQIFSGAKAIATGAEKGYSLILANDGTVYATGLNYFGQLGIGNTEEFVFEFTKVIDNTGAFLTDVTAIAAGNDHSLALKTDGTLWATGWNISGQLGAGDKTDRNQFTQVTTGVKTMSAGELHTVVVKNGETIETFGKVNPFYALNGNSSIVIKVNDNRYGQYITRSILSDSDGLQLYYYSQNITNANPLTISVKPGTFNLEFRVSNSTAVRRFNDVVVADNETVTFTYEYVSAGLGSYEWTVTRTPK